jgi:hypothetical protein
MKSVRRALACLFFLGFTAVAVLAQTQAGVIKALKVTGAVSRIAADGSEQPLADGALLAESDTVVTGTGSGVVLVFMNGSSVKLGAKSRLAVEEFKMDPLAEDIAIAQLKKEPTVSRTRLNLTYGEMVGDVKKLNVSSKYDIKTPVGAAGIRGTTFRIVFTPSENGSAVNFVLSTSEGVVVFQGTTDAAPVQVSAGTEVVVAAEVNVTTGEVTSAQVQSQGISSDATREIQAAVTQVIQEAQAAAVFTPAEQNSGTERSSTPTEGTKTGANTPEESKEEGAGAEAPAGQSRTTTDTSTPVISTPQPIDTSTISRSN